MPHEQLRESVQELRNQLDSGHPLGAEQLQALSELLNEIQLVLENEDPTAAEPAPITAKLREFESRFEDSHPELTFAVGGVVRALSKFGI